MGTDGGGGGGGGGGEVDIGCDFVLICKYGCKKTAQILLHNVCLGRAVFHSPKAV